MPDFGSKPPIKDFQAHSFQEASAGAVGSAAFEVGMRETVFGSFMGWMNKIDAEDVPAAQQLTKSEAAERIRKQGLDPSKFSLDDLNAQDEVDNQIWLNKRNATLNRFTDQASQGSFTNSAVALGSTFGAEALDPFNWATAYIPVGGTVRLARAGQHLGKRMLARAQTAAIEGAVVGALGQPLVAYQRARRGEEYSMGEFMMNVTMDAMVGGILSSGGGLISDVGQRKMTGRIFDGGMIQVQGEAQRYERAIEKYGERQLNDLVRSQALFDYMGKTADLDTLMAPEYVKQRTHALANVEGMRRNNILSDADADAAIARINSTEQVISIRLAEDGSVQIDMPHPPKNSVDVEGFPTGVRERVAGGMDAEDAIREYAEELAAFEARSAFDVQRMLGNDAPPSLSERIADMGGLDVADLAVIGGAGGFDMHPAFVSSSVPAADLQRVDGDADLPSDIFQLGAEVKADHIEMAKVLDVQLEVGEDGIATRAIDPDAPPVTDMAKWASLSKQLPSPLKKRLDESRFQVGTPEDFTRAVDSYFVELEGATNLEDIARLVGEERPVSLSEWFSKQDASGKGAIRRIRSDAISEGYISPSRAKGMSDEAFLKLIDADAASPSIYRSADAKRITEAKNRILDIRAEVGDVTRNIVSVRDALKDPSLKTRGTALNVARQELGQIEQGRTKAEVEARKQGKSLHELRRLAVDEGYIKPTATDKEFLKAIKKDITSGTVYTKKTLSDHQALINDAIAVFDQATAAERKKVEAVSAGIEKDVREYIGGMQKYLADAKNSSRWDWKVTDEIVKETEAMPEVDANNLDAAELSDGLRAIIAEDSPVHEGMDRDMDVANRTESNIITAAEEILQCQLGIAPKGK